MLFGHEVLGSEPVGDRVQIHLSGPEGVITESADHIIAGTGFRFDLNRLGYLTPSIRADLKLVGGAPVLDRNLESNVPGLFVTGALAAPSMGPLMRFVAGTHFVGPRLAHRLGGKQRRAARPNGNAAWQSIPVDQGEHIAPAEPRSETENTEPNELIA